MPLSLNFNFRDAGQRRREQAAQRLAQVLGAEQTFGTQPKITVADLMDYETAYDRKWPKKPVTPEEDMSMQQDMGGGHDIAMNVPSETIARPISSGERLIRDVLQKETADNIGQRQKMQNTYGRLSDFIGDKFNDEDILHNMGLETKPPVKEVETWGDSYEGPRGSFLQRSNSGKIREVVNAASAGSQESNQLKTQKEFRNQILKLYGASDLSSLDENLRTKVNEISVNAWRKYLADPNKEFNRALSEAFDESESKHATLETIPSPDRGYFGNNEEEVAQVAKIMLKTYSAQAVAQSMINKGWTQEEVQNIISQAVGNPGDEGNGQLQQRYNTLRQQGKSKQEAARELGIPLQ